MESEITLAYRQHKLETNNFIDIFAEIKGEFLMGLLVCDLEIADLSFTLPCTSFPCKQKKTSFPIYPFHTPQKQDI